MRSLIALLAFLTLTADLSAAIVISQDFNNLSPFGTFTGDRLAPGGQLTNAGSSSVKGYSFATFFAADTRGNADGMGPVTGGEGGDFIGVNAFTGGNAPDVAADGTAVAAGVEHNFEFNDTDGLVELRFETLATAGLTDRMFSFDYWINDTGFEATDQFIVTLTDGITTATLLDFGEPDLEGNASPDDGTANWQSLAVDVEALGFAGGDLSLTFGVDVNSGVENIFIDNVTFTAVPEPTSLALVMLSGSVLFVRRRKA